MPKSKHNMAVAEFCKRYVISAGQFYGEEKINGDLDLRSLTSIPEGFAPTCGGDLDLRSLPERERAKVHVREPGTAPITWQGGKYILADGVLSEVVSHRGNVYRTRQIGAQDICYLVTDGTGKWAHGATLAEARADLVYKIGDRDTSRYAGLVLDSRVPFAQAVEMYRVITGACALGTKGFVQGLEKVKKSYTVSEIISITDGRYGHGTFKSFFTGE